MEIKDTASEGLRKLKKALQKNAENILTVITKEIEGDAKKLAPVDTGRLRASITSQVYQSIYGMEWVGEIGTDVHYAPYQEFGTKRMKAQPYLYPALRMNLNKLKSMTIEQIRSIKP